MVKGILSSVRNFFRLAMMLVFAVVLVVLALGSWQLYKNEKKLQKFMQEGYPVKVQVTATDRQNRTWYDQFSNKVYITFNYNNRLYTTRYVQDSGWVNAGDKVSLLYHADDDGFRQLNRQMHFNKPTINSRLISFSFMGRWNEGQKWLLLTLMLTTAFALVTIGAINSVVIIPMLGLLGRFIITGLVVCVALYFTYNAWQYNQYYNKIKNNSKQETVTVLGTNSHARSKRNSWF
jgi:magnesium-transporting ATPase (P-type)